MILWNFRTLGKFDSNFSKYQSKIIFLEHKHYNLLFKIIFVMCHSENFSVSIRISPYNLIVQNLNATASLLEFIIAKLNISYIHVLWFKQIYRDICFLFTTVCNFDIPEFSSRIFSEGISVNGNLENRKAHMVYVSAKYTLWILQQ